MAPIEPKKKFCPAPPRCFFSFYSTKKTTELKNNPTEKGLFGPRTPSKTLGPFKKTPEIFYKGGFPKIKKSGVSNAQRLLL